MSTPTVGPAINRLSLRTLPARIWAPLVGILLISIAFAIFGSQAGLIVLGLISIGLVVTLARSFAMEAALRDCTQELSALSTHLQSVVEQEKSELAHNLHDELGGLLTAAKMDLSWIQGRIADQPQIQQRLHQLGNVLDEAMDMKRRVVEDLRPSLLDHFGLPTALRAYFEAECKKANLRYEVTMAEDEVVPKTVAIALFRVIQQGLANIIAHAEARSARLEFSADASGYVLKLMDDGKGMDLSDPRLRYTNGIMAMRHRVRALGGTFDLDSTPKHGTTLRAQVPKSTITE
jgi:signal transduction histidine kinase